MATAGDTARDGSPARVEGPARPDGPALPDAPANPDGNSSDSSFTPSEAEVAAEVRRRLKVLGRRYYPIGIGAAVLATVVAAFPSTSPLGLGGSLFAGARSGTSPPAAAGAPASAAPAGTPNAQGSGGATGSSGYTSALGLGSAAGYPGASAAAGLGGEAATSPSASAGSPSPTTGDTSPGGGAPAPATQCPIPVPTTGTPLDSVLAAVTSLCNELSGIDGTTAGRGPMLETALDEDGGPLPYSGAAGSSTILAVLQGASVPSQVANQLAAARRDGTEVVELLMPELSAPGGSSAFASWVQRTVAALPEAELIAVGASAPASSTQTADMSADLVAGLGAAERAADAGQHIGLWWTDGGGSQSDTSLWRALVSGEHAPTSLAASSFVATTLSGSSGQLCSQLGGFETALDETGQLAGLPAVVETAAGPFPAAPGSADAPQCPDAGKGRVTDVRRLGAGPYSGN